MKEAACACVVLLTAMLCLSINLCACVFRPSMSEDGVRIHASLSMCCICCMYTCSVA